MRYLLPHFFADNLLSLGDRIAIDYGDRQVTYAELRQKADQFKGRLLSSGLSKGDRVAVLSAVSPEVIAALIACLELGVVYIPVNIHAPAEWQAKVIKKCAAAHLIYGAGFEEKAAALQDLSRFKEMLSLSDQGQNGDPPVAVSPKLLADDIAYILFTSGSTGDPKGILLSHRNAYTFTEWMREFFDVRPDDRVLSRAPLQFDLSVFDIFTTLSAGATIVIAPPEFSEEADAVVDFMTAKKISIIYTVPSAYIRLLNKGGLERGIPSLRLAFYAGEPFPPAYLARVNAALRGTEMWNIYGPTETNIVTYFRVPAEYHGDAPVPIGQGVVDTEIFILGPDLMPVAEGEIGEIVVRGGTVFKGYLNDPVLTTERLVQCPWHFYPENFCRTGDLGRIDAAGMIEYHGRKDNMIKTRGYRVEIDEVENALSEIPGVVQCAVVALPHPRFTHTLHAFIQLGEEAGLTPEDAKAALGRKIPDYMVPFTFDLIEEFPKTSTAKIDRVGLIRIAEKKMHDAANA